MTHETKLTIWEKNRILLKGLLMAGLILVMLIPQSFITGLVQERAARQNDVIKEVSSKWAGGQNIVGPVLILPYKEFADAGNGKQVEYIHQAYFLPDKLLIKGDIHPEVRHRSLFSVMLYRSDISLQGHFDTLQLAAMNIKPENVQWQDARLVMNVGDAKGLEDDIHLTWNGMGSEMKVGVPGNQVLKKGFNALVQLNNSNPVDFTVSLKIKGSDYLYFTPVGRTTEVSLQSPWKDPAFEGQYLPTQSPEVSGKGFVANWKILPLSQANPQYWSDSNVDLTSSAFGVKLIQPVDEYAKTDRTVKYALLFIALTFTFFFFFEILQKRQVHPLQYLLVGIALTIFYTLLLSISEYTGFNIAYWIATTAVITLIGLYVWSIFSNGRTAIIFVSSLTGLYLYIFLLIQLQDYALLFGSIGLFLIIALMMYYSRKIDWYGLHKQQEKKVIYEEPENDESFIAEE